MLAHAALSFGSPEYSSLVVLALIVALSVAAVQRLLAPQPIHGEAVTVVAGIGLAVPGRE